MKTNAVKFDQHLFEEARSIMKHRFPDLIEGYLEDAEIYIQKIKKEPCV